MPTDLYFDDTKVDVRTIKFSGGEVQPRITDGPTSADVVKLVCHARNSDDVMEMLLLRDAADEWFRRYGRYPTVPSRYELEIPYLPCA